MYNRYVDWAKKEIGMGKYSSIQFINPERGNYGTRPA